MTSPYDPVKPSMYELVVRIDERLQRIQIDLDKHLADDEHVHEDHEKRLHKVEAWKTGTMMVAGLLGIALPLAGALAATFWS